MFGDKIKAFAQKKYGADKHLAAALGMSPQQLAAYTAEKRKPGFEILQKLAGLGCSVSWILDDDKTIDELNNSFDLVKGDSENNGILDLAGAIELSNTPASRLAQLVGVSPATFTAWQNGTATPTVEEPEQPPRRHHARSREPTHPSHRVIGNIIELIPRFGRMI